MPNRCMCAECREKANHRSRATTARAMVLRMCIQCKKVRVNKKVRCDKCARKHKKGQIALRRKRRLEVVCTNCGGEIPFAREGYKTCGNC